MVAAALAIPDTLNTLGPNAAVGPIGAPQPVMPVGVSDPVQDQLTEEERAALEDLVTGVLKEESWARRDEVRRAWEQRSYKIDIQHFWYDSKTYTLKLPEANTNIAWPRYMDVYNIYIVHHRSLTSLLSQDMTGVNAKPRVKNRPNDINAAGEAEKARETIAQNINMAELQQECASLFCTDGRVVAWTRIEDGKLKATLHGVLESKTPCFVWSMNRWPYCVLSEEIDLYEAKDDAGEFADEIESTNEGSADSSYARYARLGILAGKSGTGEALKNIVTKNVAWIRPSRFRKLPDNVRDSIRAKFPDGVRVKLLGGVCVEAISESMDAALRVQWPISGKGQKRPSLLSSVVPIQDAFNDYKNNLRDAADFINPATWVSDAVDEEAIPEQKSEPGAIHRVGTGGAPIGDVVMQETSPGLPQELINECETLLRLAELTCGDLPSLQGQGTPDSETYSGQKLLQDQAKGQLGPAWKAEQWLFAGIFDLAIPLEAQLVLQNGTQEQASFNPVAVLEGHFNYYPDPDSGFPETTADKRAAFQTVANQIAAVGPDGIAILGNPSVLRLGKTLSGLNDFFIQAVESDEKQLEEIEQLLKEGPVDAPPTLEAGQPMPSTPQQKSSMDVDQQYDFHEYELTTCKQWLSSPARREEERKGNQAGVLNVRLHADQHQAAITAAQTAPPIPPPKVSIAIKTDDPTATANALNAAGLTASTPQTIEASQIPEQQNLAADTQNKAAGAQHKAVLAAKEAVAPVKEIPSPQAPDQVNQGDK